MGRFIITIIGGAYFLSIILNAVGLNTWLPSCVITKLTGFHCFGCGLNRAAIFLLQGNVQEAIETNPMILPIIFAMIISLMYIFRIKTTANING